MDPKEIVSRAPEDGELSPDYVEMRREVIQEEAQAVSGLFRMSKRRMPRL